MILPIHRSLVVDERHLTPAQRVHPEPVARRAADLARDRRSRHPHLLGWTVHLAVDGMRVVTTEIWGDADAAAAALRTPKGTPEAGRDARRYRYVASTGAAIDLGGGEGGPGVLIIDRIPVPRPLTRPIAAFTARNGRAFADSAGCLGTAVLRSRPGGRIATYARWQSEQHFLDAFSATQGTPVSSLAEIDATTARMTRGLIRTDYHRYELVAAETGSETEILR